MSASTGDWWHNAVTAAAEVIEDEAMRNIGRDLGTLYRDEIVAAGLAAALPLFVAEATRRIEAQKAEQRGPEWAGFAVGNATFNEGLRRALDAVAGLAGEVGQ